VIPAQIRRDELRIPDGDLNKAGLLKPSLLKAGKLFTLHQSLIHKRLGSLPPAMLQKALERIGEVIPKGDGE
jgi:hypothetical protein